MRSTVLKSLSHISPVLREQRLPLGRGVEVLVVLLPPADGADLAEDAAVQVGVGVQQHPAGEDGLARRQLEKRENVCINLLHERSFFIYLISLIEARLAAGDELGPILLRLSAGDVVLGEDDRVQRDSGEQLQQNSR